MLIVYVGPSASVDILDPDRDAVHVAERDVPVDVRDELAVSLLEQVSFKAVKPAKPIAAVAADKDVD